MTDQPSIFYDVVSYPTGVLAITTTDDYAEITARRIREVTTDHQPSFTGGRFENRQVLVDLDRLAGGGFMADPEAIARIDHLYDTNPAFHALAQLYFRRGLERGAELRDVEGFAAH